MFKYSLIRQLENPVLWFDTIKNMTNDSYTSYIEIGPGKVLTGLVKKIDKQFNKSKNLLSVSKKTKTIFLEISDSTPFSQISKKVETLLRKI